MLEKVVAVVGDREVRRGVGEVHDAVPADRRVVARHERAPGRGAGEHVDASLFVDTQHTALGIADQEPAVVEYLDPEGPPVSVREFGGVSAAVEPPDPAVVASGDHPAVVIDCNVLRAFPGGKRPAMRVVEHPVGREHSRLWWWRRGVPDDGVDTGAVELAGERLEEGHEL